MENENKENRKVDALCPECGYAFKTYVDRILPPENDTEENPPLTCPVCGCGECSIGK